MDVYSATETSYTMPTEDGTTTSYRLSTAAEKGVGNVYNFYREYSATDS